MDLGHGSVERLLAEASALEDFHALAGIARHLASHPSGVGFLIHELVEQSDAPRRPTWAGVVFICGFAQEVWRLLLGMGTTRIHF